MTGVTLSCRILGTDGFDLDVLHNLVRFYRRLGARPVLAREPGPADLLVVQRPSDRPLDLRSYRAVHLWDYVGTPIDQLLAASSGAERMTVFTTSQRRADELRDTAGSSGARLVVLPPPVDVDLWRSPLRSIEHRAVHIGNFKPYYADGSDRYASRFLAALQTERAPVWGAGWRIPDVDARGRLGQFSVSTVYTRSAVAFGMMYPFQRDISFSGRFWHAPINGCRILSEPSVYAGSWPGVVETDYSAAEVAAALEPTAGRELVRDEALSFWRAHWTAALADVGARLRGMPEGRHRRTSVVDLARSGTRLVAHRLRA